MFAMHSCDPEFALTVFTRCKIIKHILSGGVIGKYWDWLSY